MTITEIIMINFITLTLIFGMGVLVLTNRSFEKRTNQYFMIFILLILILDIADMGDYYMAWFDRLCRLRYVTSAIGYTLRPAIIAIVMNILLRRKKVNIVFWIPVFLNGLIAATSYFTHWMYWFTSDNGFARGPLGYMSHVVSGIYMLVLIYMTIRMHRFIEAGEMVTICYIVSIDLLAAVLESLYWIKFLLPGAMIVSCSIYYVFLYVQTYKRDILTEVLNRRSFYLDSEKMKNQAFAIISIDLNGLKDLNDTKGHQEGDKALKLLADILMEVLGNEYRIYRIGGDEFTAIGKNQSMEDAREQIERVKEVLSKTKYMASFGYAIHDPLDDIDEKCNEADACMYEDKKNYKHRTSAYEIG